MSDGATFCLAFCLCAFCGPFVKLVQSKPRVKCSNLLKSAKVVPDDIPLKRCNWITPNSGICLNISFFLYELPMIYSSVNLIF